MQCFIGKASARFRTAVRFFQISTSSTSKSVDCMIGFQQCPHNHSYLHFIHFPNCDPFSFPGIIRCYLVHATRPLFFSAFAGLHNMLSRSSTYMCIADSSEHTQSTAVQQKSCFEQSVGWQKRQCKKTLFLSSQTP
jgi:hypothetical protein